MHEPYKNSSTSPIIEKIPKLKLCTIFTNLIVLKFSVSKKLLLFYLKIKGKVRSVKM